MQSHYWEVTLPRLRVTFRFEAVKGYTESWVQAFIDGLKQGFLRRFEDCEAEEGSAFKRGNLMAYKLLVFARHWGLEDTALNQIDTRTNHTTSYLYARARRYRY